MTADNTPGFASELASYYTTTGKGPIPPGVRALEVQEEVKRAKEWQEKLTPEDRKKLGLR